MHTTTRERVLVWLLLGGMLTVTITGYVLFGGDGKPAAKPAETKAAETTPSEPVPSAIVPASTPATGTTTPASAEKTTP